MTQMGCKACVMATPNHHESIDQFAGKHGMQSSLQPFELYHDECSSVSHAELLVRIVTCVLLVPHHTLSVHLPTCNWCISPSVASMRQSVLAGLQLKLISRSSDIRQ